MPTVQQRDWIAKHRDLCVPPYADIGSRAPISRGKNSKARWESLRPLFAGESFAGIDMQKGRDVDVLCDLSASLPSSMAGMFRTAFCLSVLEHVRNPWAFAANVKTMLAAGGVLFVSVPWCWRYHGHPGDYWRMSPDAVRSLFPEMEWLKDRSCIWHGVKQKPLKTFDIRLTRVYADRDKHLMYPVTVNMVFRKP